MKLKKSLLLILFIVLISSCEETTFYYKIPMTNKILAIYTPAFSDYAYVYIGMHKLNAMDSFDLKIYKGETTEVSLILNKQKNDTIYYSDRWDDVTLITKKRKYKRIEWYDDKFYNKDTNKCSINQNYIEVVIKDYAAFVVYQLNNSYRILKPIPENEKNFENRHPTTDRLYVRDIEMNAYIDALSKVIIILNEAYKDLRMAYITINTNAFF